MATSTISGLASGLDTASIIEQLMQLEAIPQSKLRTKVSSTQSVISSLQTLNTKVSVAGSRAEALAKPEAWQVVSAKSSDAAVTVTAAGTAQPASLTVTVLDVARTHQLGFAEPVDLASHVTGATGSVRLDRFDGSPLLLSTDGTLQGLVAAINDPANETGLRASAIRVGTDGGVPQYQLLVESAATGVAEDFDLTAEDGSALLGGATVRAGTDARISLGTGITVGSATNTFTGVLDGIDLTLSETATNGTVSTVSVTRDVTALAGQVQTLVDALNAALGEIATQTAFTPGAGTSGRLMGNAIVRELRDSLLDTVYPASGSLAAVGIQTTRTGTLTFDAAKFKEAYQADPAAVAEMFTTGGNGFAARVQAAASAASNPQDGTITTAITGRKDEVSRLEKNIEDWDLRLELRRTTLVRQYTALETALSQLNSQSSWLAAQIESLTQSSSK